MTKGKVTGNQEKAMNDEIVLEFDRGYRLGLSTRFGPL